VREEAPLKRGTRSRRWDGFQMGRYDTSRRLNHNKNAPHNRVALHPFF